MKPKHYDIGIDTFERMRANATYEEAMGFIRWNIDKYNTRKKGQTKNDYEKIKAYCNEAIWWEENRELTKNAKPILSMDKNYYNEIWPKLKKMGWYREGEDHIFWHHGNSDKILEVLGDGDINVLKDTKLEYVSLGIIEYSLNMYNEVDKLTT